MKKLLLFLFLSLLVHLTWSQQLADYAQQVYLEGIPQVVSLRDGDSLLNVKLVPGRKIWVTINYRDGTQRATEIVRVDFDWTVSPRKKENFTLIAGFNTSGQPLLSFGFPDGRKIYQGDKKLIRSSYSQRDLTLLGRDDYLISIKKWASYQLYHYKDGVTRYPELVTMDSLQNSDLINLSYFGDEVVFDAYSDGQYKSYLSKKNGSTWGQATPLDIDFLQGFHSVNIQDSLVVGIRDNQLYIWEIIPDSWWVWEPLEVEAQIDSSRADTATNKIVMFFWEGDDEPNFMDQEMFEYFGFSIDSSMIIEQDPQEVIDIIGENYGMTANPQGYMFSSSTFDVITNPGPISSQISDNGGDGSDTLRTLIDLANKVTIQVGIYGPTYFAKHRRQGGFEKVIGGGYVINEIWNKKRTLVYYQIDMSGVYTEQKVIDALLDYTDRLAQLQPPDRPFLILEFDDGSVERYYYEDGQYKKINK